MHARIALGLASLMAATSCVGSAIETARVDPAAAPAPTAPTPATDAIPAGPPPALLAAAPDAGPSIAVDLLAAPPFLAAAASPRDAGRALDCLTAAIYYEARSEPVEGQEAVAQVVLNRVRNPAFPNSVCGTVYEGSARETGCQFTFTCDGSLAGRREPAAWERARKIAAQALAGFVYEPVGAATYYHTTAVHPWWDAKVRQVAHIGAHVFFQLPGAWSGALAYRQHYGGVEPSAAVALRTPEKATDDFVQAIEAGVRIHRAAEEAVVMPADAASAPVAAEPTVVERFGVDIHRGSAAPAVAREGGVHIHRGDVTA